jgi:serine/threonine protein kinase
VIPNEIVFDQWNQPNIVAFYYSQGWGRGLDLEVFMPLYHGDLRILISSHDPVVYASAFFKTILEVLNFLAVKGVTHGDVKPANILFDSFRQFYLTDFGLVGSARAPLGYFISELYAAPEAYENQLCPKSDIWSLGVIVLEIFKRRPEFPPPLIWANQRETYWKDIVSAASDILGLSALLSPNLLHRDDAAKCLDRFFSNDRTGWPFREGLQADVEMAIEIKRRKPNPRPDRIAKKLPKPKKPKRSKDVLR